jgi:hypothetical protein
VKTEEEEDMDRPTMEEGQWAAERATGAVASRPSLYFNIFIFFKARREREERAPSDGDHD